MVKALNDMDKEVPMQGAAKAPPPSDTSVWEDTIILAFRELQRQQWVDRGNAKIRAAWKESAGQPLDVIPEALSRALAYNRAGPPAALKLDGYAESIAGDLVTAIDEQFFIFEFKSAEGQKATERKKTLFRLFAEKIVGQAPENAELKKLSQMCHFGVYGKTVNHKKPENGAVAKQPADPEGLSRGADGLPGMALEVLTQTYWRWVEEVRFVEDLKKAPGANPSNTGIGSAPETLGIQQRVWPKRNRCNFGLALGRMITYLDVLSRLVEEEGDGLGKPGGAPLKMAIAGTMGFFAVIGSLTDLNQIATLFGKQRLTGDEVKAAREAASDIIKAIERAATIATPQDLGGVAEIQRRRADKRTTEGKNKEDDPPLHVHNLIDP